MSDFYRKQSEYTSPGKWLAEYKELPDEMSELVKIVQNIIIHKFWIINKENYNVAPKDFIDKGRKPNDEINLLTAEEILTKYYEINSASFLEEREAVEKVVGNCRDFTLLLVSFLRQKGIRARSRSGVAAYFTPKQYEDHFVCEYYNDQEKRWIVVDAQLDDLMKKKCGISFDTLDVPSCEFLNSAESIRKAREEDNAMSFGIDEYRGINYLNYKLFSDLAHMNKEEILPWEGWGIGSKAASGDLSDSDMSLLEEIESVIEKDDFDGLTSIYSTKGELKRYEGYEPFYLELPFLKS